MILELAPERIARVVRAEPAGETDLEVSGKDRSLDRRDGRGEASAAKVQAHFPHDGNHAKMCGHLPITASRGAAEE
jgi:hypothetical protein